MLWKPVYELWVYDLSNNTTFGFDVSPVTINHHALYAYSTFEPSWFHTIGEPGYDMTRACDTDTHGQTGTGCGVSADAATKHALWVHEHSKHLHLASDASW